MSCGGARNGVLLGNNGYDAIRQFIENAAVFAIEEIEERVIGNTQRRINFQMKNRTKNTPATEVSSKAETYKSALATAQHMGASKASDEN